MTVLWLGVAVHDGARARRAHAGQVLAFLAGLALALAGQAMASDARGILRQSRTGIAGDAVTGLAMATVA